jgi:hypothetical protein
MVAQRRRIQRDPFYALCKPGGSARVFVIERPYFATEQEARTARQALYPTQRAVRSIYYIAYNEVPVLIDKAPGMPKWINSEFLRQDDRVPFKKRA